MIDDTIKKYLQNAINKTNTGSVLGKIPNIETIYFKLPFIAMYSEISQNKIKIFVKDFAKMPKLN